MIVWTDVKFRISTFEDISSLVLSRRVFAIVKILYHRLTRDFKFDFSLEALL